MKTKLKQKLRAGEVIALVKYLNEQLKAVPLEQLRENPADFLIMSALYELYAKMKDQAENIRLFSSRKSEDVYTVTITRTQALALCCTVVNEPPGQGIQSYEANFMQSLIGLIYQTFLI